MAYIGSIPAYQASGVRPRDEFTADGTQICFPLSQSVPGSFESGVTIVLDNVPQQPVEAFTVVDTRTLTLTSISGTFTVNETITGATSTATGTVLKVNLGSIVIRGLTGTFSSSEGITGGSSSATATTTNVTINTGSGILFSEIPTSGSIIYVVHEGNATYNLVPTAASVGPSQLADNLRNFTVDTFTGDGSTVAFTLTDTPSSANALLVMVDGIVQTRTTNYTLATNVVTFTGAPDSGAAITIIHLGFSTISRTGLVDGSVTTAKIADGSITAAKIADGTIIAADVAAGAITPAKLSTGGLYWDTSSNVGINTTSMNAVFNVQSNGTSTTAGGNVVARLQSNATGRDATLQFSDNVTNSITISQLAGATVFKTNGTESMRIAANGLVGINTTSPTTNLTVDTNTANYTDGITIANRYNWGYGSSLNFATIPTNGGSLATVGRIQQYYQASNLYGLAFSTYNSGISAALNLNPYGNVALNGGTTTATGVGITFPATQVASSDPNCLDDYEEGTWTPGIAFGGASTGVTYSSRSGTYTKIGRTVTVSAIIYCTNKGSSTGSVSYTGLPFTVASADDNFGGLAIAFMDSITFSGTVFLRTYAGSNTVLLSQSTTAGSGTDLTNSNCSNVAFIRFAGTYQASA